MSEKVVLPKFDLPGKQMHPAMKVLWASVAMMVFAVGGLGFVLWRHHAQVVAEENRKQAEIEAKAAEAKAAADVAKAHAEEAKAKVALVEAEAKKAREAKNAPAAAGDGKQAPTAGHHHPGHHGSKGGAKTTVAKAGAGTDEKKPPAKGNNKKGDDVVDKLLASFK
jgi:cytoskeletal protein RodZ